MKVFINTEKAINIKIKNCYMNCEELHSYRDPSLKSKGRGVSGYILADFTLLLLFKGRAGMG